MDIWIIRNGEKYGPFPDYDIRRRIEAGELTADTPAWHEGLPAWIPIRTIPLFENEFKAAPAAGPKPSAAAPTQPLVPPPIPEKPKLIRRFWARWLDIFLYAAVWWLALYAANRNIGDILLNHWVILTQLVPWLVIEILLIHRFATTPGKWLLGLRLLNADGSRLTLAQSTRRAARVFLLGIGLGWPYVSVFCQILSGITARRLGAPLWDQIGNHRMVYAPLSVWRVALFAALFFVAIHAQLAVVYPYVSKYFVEQSPELKEMFLKNPQWHLPPRH